MSEDGGYKSADNLLVELIEMYFLMSRVCRKRLRMLSVQFRDKEGWKRHWKFFIGGRKSDWQVFFLTLEGNALVKLVEKEMDLKSANQQSISYKVSVLYH